LRSAGSKLPTDRGAELDAEREVGREGGVVNDGVEITALDVDGGLSAVPFEPGRDDKAAPRKPPEVETHPLGRFEAVLDVESEVSGVELVEEDRNVRWSERRPRSDESGPWGLQPEEDATSTCPDEAADVARPVQGNAHSRFPTRHHTHMACGPANLAGSNVSVVIDADEVRPYFPPGNEARGSIPHVRMHQP